MMPWLELDFALPLPDFELKVSFRTTSSVLGIFGPSGAGKSSLLESIVGIRKTVRGSIRVKGVTWLDDKTTLPAFRRRVGWVPQNHRLFPHWTVRRNLLAGRSGSLRAEQASKDFFEKSVDLLELGPLLERMPESLSGGESQRVAMGRALCAGPEVLILDEPISSMDKRLRARILGYLREVQSVFGIPTIIVSHEATELQALCGEVVVLDHGRVLDCGQPTQVFTRYFGTGNDLARSDFVNVLPGRLSLKEADALYEIRLGKEGGGPKVHFSDRVPDTSSSLCDVRIASSDIVLSKDPVGRVSAQNRLAATVKGLDAHSQLVWVSCQMGDLEVIASLTKDAVESLDLELGDAVTLLIKAQAVRLF